MHASPNHQPVERQEEKHNQRRTGGLSNSQLQEVAIVEVIGLRRVIADLNGVSGCQLEKLRAFWSVEVRVLLFTRRIGPFDDIARFGREISAVPALVLDLSVPERQTTSLVCTHLS